jgi:hypothetical protein
MWTSLFAIAVAAAVCLSAVNVASEIAKIHEARPSVVVEHSMPSGAPPLGRATDAGASTIRKTDPGA